MSGLNSQGIVKNQIALTQDPFTDAASQDYTLDPTGADYATILSANDSGLVIPNTTVGPRLSSFTEAVSGSTIKGLAGIERLK